MTKEKDKNPYKKLFANMSNAGGNHQARTSKEIIKEDRKSYKHTIDKKLNTNHAKSINPYKEKFAPIKQELGSPAAKAQKKVQVKQPPKPKGRGK